jgi:hypothetical protein
MAEDIGKVVGSFADPHPDYRNAFWNWYAIRIAMQGESSIKRHNEMFLPMPSGMIDAVTTPSTQRAHSMTQPVGVGRKYIPYTENPNYHNNAAYAAYKSRANYPELVGYTVRGLTGIATRNPPQYELPSNVKYLEDEATKENLTLINFYDETIEEVLAMGRNIIVVDICEEDDKPKFVSYPAEAMINWKTHSNSNHDPYMIVFKSSKFVDDDVFSHECEDVYRILSLEPDETGYDVYTVTEVTEDGTIIKRVQPSYRGKKLGYIPIAVAGSNNNLMDIDVQPMMAITNIAQQIYMLSADLRNSEYMSCNPALVISGIDKEEAPTTLGSTVALILENPEAKAYFTETDTSALNHVLSHIQNLMNEAAIHGTSLLGPTSNVVEAATALKIRQSAASATLSSIVVSVGNAISIALKYAADWVDGNPDDVIFRPNKNFVELSLSSSEITALVNAWQRGAISGESMLNNFKKSGLLVEDDEIESEKKRLEEQGLPPMVAMQQITQSIAEGAIRMSDEGSPWGNTKMSRILDQDLIKPDDNVESEEASDEEAIADRDRPR